MICRLSEKASCWKHLLNTRIKIIGKWRKKNFIINVDYFIHLLRIKKFFNVLVEINWIYTMYWFSKKICHIKLCRLIFNGSRYIHFIRYFLNAKRRFYFWNSRSPMLTYGGCKFYITHKHATTMLQETLVEFLFFFIFGHLVSFKEYKILRRSE